MSTDHQQTPPVLQLRLIIRTEDFARDLHFYRDVLGLHQQAAFEGDGDARVAILDAGRATLELANPEQVRLINEVEGAPPVDHHLRVAFEVADTVRTHEVLVAAGAAAVAPPRVTPWQSLNARLEAPGGVQLTLFQELETLEERTQRAGFQELNDRPRNPPAPG